MRIIALIHKDSGVSFHRIILPLLLMRDTDVYITNNLQEKDFEKGCDLFLYNRTFAETAWPTIRKLQEQYGFKIAVDVDDWWELDPHHVLYETYANEDFATKQIHHIQQADVVLTTHERLAEVIQPYNKNVHICPNAIPKKGQFLVEREPHYLTRLFWQGSDTHREDIGILSKVAERLGPLSPKIKMIMSGYAENNEQWHQMVMDYTAGLKHQYKLIPYTSPDAYYLAYKEADICLVPLVNSPFNRMKSNLKVLEAANLGLPVICSQVHPYMDMPLLYARHPNDWLKHIERLVKSRKRQKEAGRELQGWCEEHYNFEKINEHRRQVLHYVGKKQLSL